MNTQSKPQFKEGSLEFEQTGNKNVDEALKVVSEMTAEKLQELMTGMLDLSMIFGGDCEELKDITTEQVIEGTYKPNLTKTFAIQSIN